MGFELLSGIAYYTDDRCCRAADRWFRGLLDAGRHARRPVQGARLAGKRSRRLTGRVHPGAHAESASPGDLHATPWPASLWYRASSPGHVTTDQQREVDAVRRHTLRLTGLLW